MTDVSIFVTISRVGYKPIHDRWSVPAPFRCAATIFRSEGIRKQTNYNKNTT